MQKPVPAQFHRLAPFLEFFQTGVPVLMYHKVGPRPTGVRLKGLYVSCDHFVRQLAELSRGGFSTCGPTNATGDSNGLPSRRIVLTFDDGFRNIFDNALQPLAEYKFQATQFLVPNFLGQSNEWDMRVGEVAEPLMDAGQVREWLGAGHRIGSHTLTHPRLTRLSLRDAQEEISASKKKLEDTFGVAVDSFCYPYGDWDEPIRDLVMEAGYRSACTTDFGVNTKATPPLALRRIAVRYPTRSLKALLQELKA